MNTRAVSLVLAGALLFTGATVHAETDEDVVIARVIFEPRTYELYREWAREKIEELEHSAPHGTTWNVDGRDFPLRPQHVEMVKRILSEPAVPEDKEEKYALVITHGLLGSKPPVRWSISQVVGWTIESFKYNVRGDPFVFEAKRAEHDAKIKELEQEKLPLDQIILDIERKARRELQGMNTADIHARLREVEDTVLGMKMDFAEREAKRKAILEKLQEEAKRAENKDALFEEQKGLLQRQIEVAERSLEYAKQKAEKGLLDAGEVAAAELRLLEAEQQQLRLKAHPQEESNTVMRLRELLVEMEVELAGMDARMGIVIEQKEELESLRIRALSLDDEKYEAQAQNNELYHQIFELQRRRIRLNDFPIAPPLIEWVKQPAEEK